MEKKPLAKIAITPEADSVLSQALEKVNQNNPGGRVTKTELASWFIQRLATQLSDPVIEEIRMEHFNQVHYLEELVKAAKRSGRETLNADEMERFQAVMRRKDQLKKKRVTEKNLAGEVGLDQAIA